MVECLRRLVWRRVVAFVLRSWRRILHPLLMPAGQPSKEAYVDCPTDDPLLSQLHELGLIGELDRAVRCFDWPSQVTIRFAPGDGTAAWSRRAWGPLTGRLGYRTRGIAPRRSHCRHGPASAPVDRSPGRDEHP